MASLGYFTVSDNTVVLLKAEGALRRGCQPGRENFFVDADAWREMGATLAGSGYRVVAPFFRAMRRLNRRRVTPTRELWAKTSFFVDAVNLMLTRESMSD